jgi:hypothetical protein
VETPDTSKTVAIRLLIDRETDTISGRIDGGDPFNGWLQLAAALQHLIAEAEPADGGPPV